MTHVYMVFDDEGTFIAPPHISLVGAKALVQSREEARNTHVQMMNEAGSNEYGWQEYPYDSAGWVDSPASDAWAYLETYRIERHAVAE